MYRKIFYDDKQIKQYENIPLMTKIDRFFDLIYYKYIDFRIFFFFLYELQRKFKNFVNLNTLH